jgi:iron complex transport system substrate-binding protein
MMARRALAWLVVLLPALADAGEVRDMTGRAVAVPDVPRRVISLAPGLTEIVFALGAGPVLVGVTQHCDFPPEASKKPRVGGIYNPSFEAILSLRPDLVLASTEANRPEDLRRLTDLGLPVYLVRPVDVAAVLETIDRVGAVLGRTAAARGLAGRLRGELDAVAAAVRGHPSVRVLYVVWGNPLIVPGRDTAITELIRRAGGVSVTGDEPIQYPRLSMEAAVARHPDRVVLALQGETTLDQRLKEWPHFALVPAVREGRIRGVDADLLHRQGPRLAQGLRALARAIHPELGW